MDLFNRARRSRRVRAQPADGLHIIDELILRDLLAVDPEIGQPVAWKFRGDQYLKLTDGPERHSRSSSLAGSDLEDAGAAPICTFAGIARLRGKQAETTHVDPVAPMMMAEDPPHSLDPDRSLDQVIAVG